VTKDERSSAVGILQRYVPNEGDAWRHTLDALSQYFDRVVTMQWDARNLKVSAEGGFVDLIAEATVPEFAVGLIGPYLEGVTLMGQRTAELHAALASDTEHPDFAPEPFSLLYQRSLYQTMRNHSSRTFQTLRRQLKELSPSVADETLKVLDLQNEVLSRFRSIVSRKITASRTRIHGDFHLGQVLYTGRDYVIIDFEGEPARPLTERRIKRSPLRDVAGMLRSFHYAAYTSLFGYLGSSQIRPEDLAQLEPWARMWNIWVSSTYMKAYLEHSMPAGLLPTERAELHILLNIYLLAKALYELGYELNNRPDWVRIPLLGIIQLMETPAEAAA
jgi:maltose alpha-D-glucosyltransferase/alpha-amylase